MRKPKALHISVLIASTLGATNFSHAENRTILDSIGSAAVQAFDSVFKDKRDDSVFPKVYAPNQSGRKIESALQGTDRYNPETRVSNGMVTTPALKGQSQAVLGQESGYEITHQARSTKEAVGFDPRATTFLTQHLVINCTTTVHAVIDRVRTQDVADTLVLAAQKRNLAVRLVSLEPQVSEEFQRISELQAAGVEIRYSPEPIIDNFVVCDGKSVQTGTLEAFNKDRVSYGMSATRVTYDAPNTALPYESRWSFLWGRSTPAKLIHPSGDVMAKIFDDKKAYNSAPVAPYDEAKIKKDPAFGNRYITPMSPSGSNL
jgi:hypothetical protein